MSETTKLLVEKVTDAQFRIIENMVNDNPMLRRMIEKLLLEGNTVVTEDTETGNTIILDNGKTVGYPYVKVEDLGLSRQQRFLWRVTGKLFLGHGFMDGWLEPQPIYLLRCKRHQPFLDYPSGRGRLECPMCRDESTHTHVAEMKMNRELLELP